MTEAVQSFRSPHYIQRSAHIELNSCSAGSREAVSNLSLRTEKSQQGNLLN